MAAIDAFDDIAFGLEIVRERKGERDIALDDRDARVGRVPTSMSLDKVRRDVLLRPNELEWPSTLFLAFSRAASRSFG